MGISAQVGPGPAGTPGHLDGHPQAISYDAQITWVWGELAGAAQFPQAGPRPRNDTWIAACRLRCPVPLLRLNTAGFWDFATHHGLVLPGEYI